MKRRIAIAIKLTAASFELPALFILLFGPLWISLTGQLIILLMGGSKASIIILGLVGIVVQCIWMARILMTLRRYTLTNGFESRYGRHRLNRRIRFKNANLSQHLLNRSEIIRCISAYLDHQNLFFPDGSILIVFTDMLIQKSPEFMFGDDWITRHHPGDVYNVLGEFHYFNPRFGEKDGKAIISLHLGAQPTKKQVVEALYHELDHFCWLREGRRWDYSAAYFDQPHEVRARVAASFWVFKTDVKEIIELS